MNILNPLYGGGSGFKLAGMLKNKKNKKLSGKFGSFLRKSQNTQSNDLSVLEDLKKALKYILGVAVLIALINIIIGSVHSSKEDCKSGGIALIIFNLLCLIIVVCLYYFSTRFMNT